MQEKIQRRGSGLHDLAIAHQHVLFEICDLWSNAPTAMTTVDQIKTLSPPKLSDVCDLFSRLHSSHKNAIKGQKFFAIMYVQVYGFNQLSVKYLIT